MHFSVGEIWECKRDKMRVSLNKILKHLKIELDSTSDLSWPFINEEGSK